MRFGGQSALSPPGEMTNVRLEGPRSCLLSQRLALVREGACQGRQ